MNYELRITNYELFFVDKIIEVSNLSNYKLILLIKKFVEVYNTYCKQHCFFFYNIFFNHHSTEFGICNSELFKV